MFGKKQKQKNASKSFKEERFKKIAAKRVQDILHKMDLLKNCANKNNYSYTDGQIRKVVSTIDEKWRFVKTQFNNSKKDKNKFILD